MHISIQRTHVHLIVEAAGRMALARGMQAFEISAARHLNAAISQRTGKARRGTVFPDRYHVEILRGPRQTRRAIAYVVNNWRRHGESQLRLAGGWKVDPFSSAPSFNGFMPVWEPRTWLLNVGWRKYGLVSATEVPGPRPKRGV